MIYRNKKNGRTIEIGSVLNSPDWEPVLTDNAIEEDAPDNNSEEDAPDNNSEEDAADGKGVRKRKRHDSSGDKSDGGSDSGC